MRWLSRLKRLREFFFLRQAIAEADERISNCGASGVAYFDAAHALLASAESLEDVSEWQLSAVTLLRHATVLGALSLALRRNLSADGTEPALVWEKVAEANDMQAVVRMLSPEARERVWNIIRFGVPPQHAEWSVAELSVLKQSLLGVTRHVVSLLEHDILGARKLRRQRATRWVALVIGLSLPGVIVAWPRKPVGIQTNLARDREVTVSSDYNPLRFPARTLVDGDVTVLGCHTRSEENPWAIIDLGSRKTVRRIVVTNRLDGVPERAIPLRIETSSDGETYTEFARQTVEFSTWTATAAPVTARNVRLQVLRPSRLHLNEVEVY